MRDPKRIHKYCNEIEKAWTRFPDWRFGQLIANIFGEELKGRDLFFVEDNVSENFFEKYAKAHSPYEARFVDNHVSTKPRHDEWVPVECDDPPEMDCYIIAWLPKKYAEVSEPKNHFWGMGVWDGEHWHLDKGAFKGQDVKVFAWMDLPPKFEGVIYDKRNCKSMGHK